MKNFIRKNYGGLIALGIATALIGVKTAIGYIGLKESQEAVVSRIEQNADEIFEDYSIGEYEYVARASAETKNNLKRFQATIPKNVFLVDSSRIEKLNAELEIMKRNSEFFRDHPQFR